LRTNAPQAQVTSNPARDQFGRVHSVEFKAGRFFFRGNASGCARPLSPPIMTPLDRRSFLKISGITLGAGLATRLTSSAWAQPAGANDAVRVAVVGFRNKGAQHIRTLQKIPGARIVALCDLDPQILAREVANLKANNITVFATTDARELLTRKDIDALLIATSTHWHALLTVWACQAGKDVYVEKPVSHTIWEGRKMVEAAEKYDRIVQAGTQFRSDVGIPEVIAWLRAGNLGKIQWIHGMWYAVRGDIGRKQPWYPDWLDYNLFCGPTPMTPLDRPQLHYDWHWKWATGNGDMSNLGVHMMDIARRIAGHDAPPRRILSLGGRFVHDDAAETPNTQFTIFDYERIPLFFEARALPAKPGVRYQDAYRNIRNGVIVQCEGGYYSGYAGGAAYDNSGKQIKRFTGDGGAGHIANFIAAVRSRKKQDLAAPIQVGHGSSSICHFGNISYRLGRAASPDQVRQSIQQFPQAVETLGRLKQHLAAHSVDIEKQPLTLGPWLEVDSAKETVGAIAGGDDAALERARFLVKETQRPPFVIPDQV
jgi:predicted dehydrogenase